MTPPKFTVVTPTYNQGKYIEKTIDSVLSQGDPNLEFIIIDGGSSDNTVEIIKKYERHLAYWVSEKDRGQSHAINKGMGKSTGEYLTWLNSDDWYLPGAMKTMRELFEANPQAGMVVGAGRIVSPNGEEVYYKTPTLEITVQSLYTWLRGGNFMQPSSAFRRCAWNVVGQVDENVHIAMDLDLWLNMARVGVGFAVTDRLLSEALSHPDAKTTAFKELTRLDCALIIIKHGGEEVVRSMLEQIVARYAWYQKNYEAIINNPFLKFIRPLVKRLSSEGNYWNDQIPPWVK
jgi:glycosyltransferase involved in cell wall biosynthesis